MRRLSKVWALGIAITIVLAGWAPGMVATAAEVELNLAPSAQAAVLMDADTGTILFEKNRDERLSPASITKVMSLLLIMEALDRGEISLDEKVRTSEYAASMGGSQIFLEPGEEMTVDDLLKGIAMASGNDATVALAEKLAGSEALFVERMNERAKELGMTNTHFENSNGLPADNHYTSAYDIATMSRELLKHESITTYTSQYQDYLRKDSKKPFWLVNTNKLVRFYSGADGLKTGYTSTAKYCLTATAMRDQFRVVAVVLGEPSTKTRNLEVSQMFDFAFSQFASVKLFKTGDVLGTLPLDKARERELVLTAPQPYSVLLRRSDDASQVRHELEWSTELRAPIAEDQEVGKLKIYHGDKLLQEFSLTAPQAIDEANWWQLFKRSMTHMFRGK